MSEERPPYDADVPPNGKPRSGKLRVATIDRQRQALDLRRAGATYQQIADRLGYANRSGAYKTIQRALHETIREAADELRTLIELRLDAALLAIWPRVIAGDDAAILSMLRIEARRARMLGLDAPSRTHVTGDVMLQKMAEHAAIEAGLDPNLVLAEARRILEQCGF